MQVGGTGAIIYQTRKRVGDASTFALAEDWKGLACSFLPSPRTSPGSAADHLLLRATPAECRCPGRDAGRDEARRSTPEASSLRPGAPKHGRTARPGRRY